jgi:hypothetical protein
MSTNPFKWLDPDYQTSRPPIDRSETYHAYVGDPVDGLTLNDSPTDSETKKQWEQFNSAKYARAFRL